MSKVLGLIDTLEAMIMDSKKIPMTDKVMISEKDVLLLLEKIRLTISSDGHNISHSFDRPDDESSSPHTEAQERLASNPLGQMDMDEARQMLDDAKVKSEKIKTGANEYADYVMANLQLLLTKMQNNVQKMEKTIEDSRSVIQRGGNEDADVDVEADAAQSTAQKINSI